MTALTTMAMIDTSVIWLAVSVLYLGTGVYLHFTYREALPATIPFAFLCFGAAIFTAVNRSTYFEAAFAVYVAELVAICLFLTAWGLAVHVVHSYLREHAEYRLS